MMVSASLRVDILRALGDRALSSLDTRRFLAQCQRFGRGGWCLARATGRRPDSAVLEDLLTALRDGIKLLRSPWRRHGTEYEPTAYIGAVFGLRWVGALSFGWAGITSGDRC
jgi:hypothetical protein